MFQGNQKSKTDRRNPQPQGMDVDTGDDRYTDHVKQATGQTENKYPSLDRQRNFT